MSRFLPLCAFLACRPPGPSDAMSAPGLVSVGEIVPGHFVVDADLDATTAASLGLTRVHYDPLLGAGLYVSEDTDLAALQPRLKQALGRPDLLCEPDRPRRALAEVDDTYRDLQWGLDALSIDDAWDLATGLGVVVAVIDSGIARHLGDAPAHIAPGWDFVDGDDTPDDVHGHGTHIAGIIAQRTDNHRGTAGIAHDATILPIRVLDDAGWGSSYDVARGIAFATDQGADVINLSLGSPWGTTVEARAVSNAIAEGIIVVAASGNDGSDHVAFPAAYPDVIAVGATDALDAVTAYSDGGPRLDVVAPGGDLAADHTLDGYGDGIIQETLGGYAFFEGTSMAAAHTSATVALLSSAGASPHGISNTLLGTASGGGSWDAESGFGLIDPVVALQVVLGGGTTTSLPGQTQRTARPAVVSVDLDRIGDRLVVAWDTDAQTPTSVHFEHYGTYTIHGALADHHELQFVIDPRQTYLLSFDPAGDGSSAGDDGIWVSIP